MVRPPWPESKTPIMSRAAVSDTAQPRKKPSLFRRLGRRAAGVCRLVLLQELEAGHGHAVVAAINKMHLTGHRPGQIGEQVKRRSAHFIEGWSAPQGGVIALVVEDHTRVRDPCTREGPHGPGRERIDADRL